MTDQLYLHEELLLLALHDQEGTLHRSTGYRSGVGAAIVVELMMRGDVELVGGEGEMKLEVPSRRDAKMPQDALLKECLEKIHADKTAREPQHWVGTFGSLGDLRHRVADRLCKRGILKIDEEKVMLLFTRKVYPESNPMPERRLMERLRRAIFGDIREVEPRLVVLIFLARRAGLLQRVFDPHRIKDRKAQLDRIVGGEVTRAASQGPVGKREESVAAALPKIMEAADSGYG